jgi:hypothetical protein
VTLTFHVLWMFCALGAVVFAATPAASWRGAMACAGTFAAAVAWWSPDRLPDHAWLGVIGAAIAALSLARPSRTVARLALAGVLAGAWSALLEVQGLRGPVAVPIAAAIPLASVALARRRPSFAVPRLVDEALIGLVAGGLMVAVLPGVLDGWRAALNLNLQAPVVDGEGVALVPQWTWLLGATALSSGALFSLWSRR